MLYVCVWSVVCVCVFVCVVGRRFVYSCGRLCVCLSRCLRVYDVSVCGCVCMYVGLYVFS